MNNDFYGFQDYSILGGNGQSNFNPSQNTEKTSGVGSSIFHARENSIYKPDIYSLHRNKAVLADPGSFTFSQNTSHNFEDPLSFSGRFGFPLNSQIVDEKPKRIHISHTDIPQLKIISYDSTKDHFGGIKTPGLTRVSS